MSWQDPRPGKRCRDCKKFGPERTGVIECPSDSSKRTRVYALDYTCDNFEARP